MPRRSSRSVAESIIKLSGFPRHPDALVAATALSSAPGVIDFTATSKTNAQATTPFCAASPALAGKSLLLQASQDCYIQAVLTSTSVVTSSTGILLFANERVTITMDDYDERAVDGEIFAWLAVIRSTADGNLKVWELR